MLKSSIINQRYNRPVVWQDRFLPEEQKAAMILTVAYRGFSLAFAVALLFLDSRIQLHPWPDGFTISAVSAYTLFRIIWPLPRGNRRFTDISFGLDMVVALGVPIFTGGLYSPFLIYSLSPVLTSAVLFRRRTTLIFACLPAISIAIGYAVNITTSLARAPNLSIYTIGFIIIYAVSSMLLGWLPYAIKNSYAETKSAAVRDERKRLSRDIHDGMAQTVGAISWKLELLQKKVAASRSPKLLTEVEDIGRLVTELQQETRDVINELRLHTPGDGGFVAGLSQCAADFTQKYGTRCEVSVSGEELEIPAPTVTELLYVAREALCNARKHASASKVELSLRFRSGLVEMRIRDDGRGFDPEQDSDGYGLDVMNERVKSVGGEMFVITKAGWGTEICVYVFADPGKRNGRLPVTAEEPKE
jgi:signal transduction histidine kinase